MKYLILIFFVTMPAFGTVLTPRAMQGKIEYLEGKIAKLEIEFEMLMEGFSSINQDAKDAAAKEEAKDKKKKKK